MLIELSGNFNVISSSQDAADLTRGVLLARDIYDQEKEHVFVIGLDLDRNVKYLDLVSIGTQDACLMHPREVFRRAVAEMASSIILIHNHPGKNIQASPADYRTTFQCMAAGKLLGIPVDASLIISTKTNDFRSLPAHIPTEYQNFDFS